jgi:hypothetical protein
MRNALGIHGANMFRRPARIKGGDVSFKIGRSAHPSVPLSRWDEECDDVKTRQGLPGSDFTTEEKEAYAKRIEANFTRNEACFVCMACDGVLVGPYTWDG